MRLLNLGTFISDLKAHSCREVFPAFDRLFKGVCIPRPAIIVSLLVFAPEVSAQPITVGKLHRYRADSINYALIIVPKNYRLDVKVSGPFVLSELSANISCDGFAMTGTFTDNETGAVEGLIVVDGQEINKKKDRTDGGFLIFDGTLASIARMRRWSSWQGDRPVDVIQSHPILILDSRIDLPLNDQRKANRVALGKLEGGPIFMVMAYDNDRQGLSAVTLLRFAQDVDRIMDGRVAWLMNFDGGPAAFIYASTEAVAPSPGRVTSYICAEAIE